MKALTLPLALACLATPALAQTNMVEVSDDTEIESFGLTADEVEDLGIYDQSGTEIGEVEEVLGSDDATPEALGVEFESDGLNDEERLVPLDQVTRGQEGVLLGEGVEIDSLEVWDD